MRRAICTVILVLVGVGVRAQHPGDTARLPQEERQALVDLYNATNGSHWSQRDGWLGPPGTECGWYGVSCIGPSTGESVFVTSLNLAENNLTGTIPGSLGQLKHVDWLMLFGNHLSGVLPQPLIQRWLSGPLYLSVETPLLTDISKIDYESSASASLCMRHRIVLNSNDSAVFFTERCRNATADDRTTFCEVKEGKIWRGEFAKLGWMLEKDGFFALQPSYDRSITHGTFESTRVIRDGKAYTVVNYADAAPFEMWTLQRAIEGVAAAVEWERPTTRATCPRWDKPDESLTK